MAKRVERKAKLEYSKLFFFLTLKVEFFAKEKMPILLNNICVYTKWSSSMRLKFIVW